MVNLELEREKFRLYKEESGDTEITFNDWLWEKIKDMDYDELDLYPVDTP